MPPDTIAALTTLCLRFREERDWAQFHNPKDMALSLMLEAGEILEHMQWKNGAQLTEHVESHREDLADELADVLYWVLVMAHDFKIDLVEATRSKLAKNAVKYPIEKSKGQAKKYTEL